tara:strand:+ start:437 stop:706 length:270 start_codon:yes stop_codon:yes gene_type:complete
MMTPVPLSMFIIGFIIFALYIGGMVMMIYYSHQRQKQEFENDPELRAYFDDIENENDNWKINPHSEEVKYYQKRLKRVKKNVGKKMFWD